MVLWELLHVLVVGHNGGNRVKVETRILWRMSSDVSKVSEN